MRSTFNLAAILLIFSLTACSHVGPAKKMSMSEMLNSPQKEALLKERIGGVWSAFVKSDYVDAYGFFDPFFRARKPREAYVSEMGKIKYHSFEIKDIKITGNIAKVTLGIVYSVPKIVIKTQEISSPETGRDVEEIWLYVYDNWYKEYYMEALETGYAKY